MVALTAGYAGKCFFVFPPPIYWIPSTTNILKMNEDGMDESMVVVLTTDILEKNGGF